MPGQSDLYSSGPGVITAAHAFVSQRPEQLVFSHSSEDAGTPA